MLSRITELMLRGTDKHKQDTDTKIKIHVISFEFKHNNNFDLVNLLKNLNDKKDKMQNVSGT